MSSTNNTTVTIRPRYRVTNLDKKNVYILRKQKLQLARYLLDPEVKSMFDYFCVVFFEDLELANQVGLPGLLDKGVVAPDLLNGGEL